MKRRQYILFYSYLLLAGLLLLTGCGDKGKDQPKEKKRPELEAVSARETYSEKGDLGALNERGILRILVQQGAEGYLPREGSPLNREREQAAAFARSLGLKSELVYLEAFEELIPALLAGKGDIIAANLTVTEARKNLISFTHPLDYSREQLVARADEKKIRKLSDLSGRTVGVQEGTSFRETLEGLRRKYPGIEMKILPGRLIDDEILDQVAIGKVDLVIEDSNIIDIALKYRSDIKTVLDLTGERTLAWGLRPENPELLKAINLFLEKEKLNRRHRDVYLDDLPGIKERKTIRMLTTNNATTYFLLRGKLMGFEYDLAKKFAEKLKLRLEVVVTPAYDDLIPWLLEGRGDFIAAFMTINREREEKGVRFTRPYHYAEEMVVARGDDRKLRTPEDLAGRTVVVRPSSSYRESLERLKGEGINLKIVAAPQTMETEEIIARVADGEYDLTVADTQILEIERSYRDDIKGVFPVSKKISHGWAVRAGDQKLLDTLNDFIKREYRSAFYNIAYKKYFKNPRKAQSCVDEYLATVKDGRISPYDDLVRKYTDKYGFLWRLIVSQMYQESRFNPKAKSWVGAEGLMQVMPQTGKEFGFTKLDDPETGIHAGVKYLDWVRHRFDDELDTLDRMCFALASYNAGAGHVRDACRLAEKMGWDPLRWFNNVERAMLLLSRPRYSKKARHGYVRGQQPVDYVRQIRDRYQDYRSLTGDSEGEAGRGWNRIVRSEKSIKKEATVEKSESAPDSGDGRGVAGPSRSPLPPQTLYTVRKGDTLSAIARKLYGDRNAWKLIYSANRDTLANPHLLKVGQVLKIPSEQ